MKIIEVMIRVEATEAEMRQTAPMLALVRRYMAPYGPGVRQVESRIMQSPTMAVYTFAIEEEPH